ncbi:NRDE protein-domain-containing protein [Crassisporium funariophilum]|nr:NRDE protein-domain-containing protein [Crassisporium funariophilum]
MTILCTNRDEFLARPTQPAHFHSFGPQAYPDSSGQVLSGRDELAGGSWFGINRAGRVALLTNITEPVKKYNTSRGDLVSSFLLSDSSHPLEDEVGKIVPEDGKYAGFNLLLLAPNLKSDGSLQYDSRWVTNHGGGGTLTSRSLASHERSCGAISNGIDGAGAELWPKVQHAISDFKSVLQAQAPDTKEAELMENLFKLLAWHPPQAIAHRSELRNTVHVTPVPIILDGSGNTTPAYYGTRLSTVLLIRKNGDVLFIERDIWELKDGGPVKLDQPTERSYSLKLDIKPNAGND